MADLEQLKRLRHSVAEWNAWRREHPGKTITQTKHSLVQNPLFGACSSESTFLE